MGGWLVGASKLRSFIKDLGKGPADNWIVTLVWVKALVPFCSHQNSWLLMDVHPSNCGIMGFQSISVFKHR